MLIRKLTPGGFGRGQWATDYDTGDAWEDRAVCVEVTPDKVVIATDKVRVTLSKNEVIDIYKGTYGIDWEIPQ